MSKKSRRKSLKSKTSKSSSHSTLWAVLVVGTAAVYAVRSGARPEPTPVAGGEARHEMRRPFFENPEEARPFPATLEPSRFGGSIVSRAYEVARQIPEVLVQQPCDCNCGVLGHRSLLDCYVSDHAATCSACLKEAVLAQQMTAEGRTPAEIRDDIEKGLWRLVSLE